MSIRDEKILPKRLVYYPYLWLYLKIRTCFYSVEDTENLASGSFKHMRNLSEIYVNWLYK